MKLKTVLCDKSRSAGCFRTHPVLHLAAISLLASQAIPDIASAQVEAAPPLAGVLGKVQSFTGSSLDVATPSGVVHVTVTQPLATYKQIPSDLSHVTSTAYVGVASVQQADGTELAKQVIIFPRELRGAAEGSSAGCARRNHSQQNDKRLRLQPCGFALPHDERHGTEGRQ